MPFTTLSSVVQANPAAINSSLEKLSCSAAGIDEIDIYPAVLSALTAKNAPPAVAEEVRVFMRIARANRSLKPADGAQQQTKGLSSSSSTTTAPIKQVVASSKPDDSYMESFNVGIAMSLHTVLLSRNRIGRLLGIVQFKHCVRLSLLGNRIRTVEDCEPLALLPDLQYLSLEFNPVAQLPHYRAHLLRICAWPHELSTRTCRLRKLDSTAVTAAEIKHAVLCIQREQTLLPELLFRMQLLAFLGDVEKRLGMHRELRRRGFVLQQTAEVVRMESMLERGAAYALACVPMVGAAHLVRLLVRDRHRLMTSQPAPSRPFGGKDSPNAAPYSTDKSSPSTSLQKRDWGGEADAMAAEAENTDPATTATLFGSDQLDTSNTASVSSVVSCSLFTDQSEGGAKIVHSLSKLLGTKELDWSRTTLRRADASAAKDTCKEWSRDAFRQTLAFLDLRMCAVLLRVARVLGQTLTAHDVDRLCQVWLHAVTHCAVLDEVAANATGPRRFVVGTGHAEVPQKDKQRTQEHVKQRVDELEIQTRRNYKSGVDAAIEQNPNCACTAEIRPSSQSCPSPSTRLPVEAAPSVHSQSVWAVGEQHGCLSTSLSSLPVVSSDISEACTDISMTSLSSDSLFQPRTSIPLPTAAHTHMIPHPSSSQQQPVSLATMTNTKALSPSKPASLSLKATAAVSKSENEPTAGGSASPSTADNLYQRHTKQQVFQQWCTSLRHRWQSRIAAAYIRDKVHEAAVQHRLSCLRSPSWSGLLTHVTYIERKRGYFNCWRRRAQVRCKARLQELERVSIAWNSHIAETLSLSQTDTKQAEKERESFAEMRQCTMKDSFAKWKSKAERKAVSRCTAARQRVLATTPHTPETFLSLHLRSPITRVQLHHKSLSTTPVESCHLLDDFPKTTEKQICGTGLPSLPLPGGFRRCDVSLEVPVKVTKWQVAPQTTTISTCIHDKDISVHTALDEEEGISPAAPSTSDGGISINSITTPFFSEPHPTPVPTEVDAANQLHDSPNAHEAFPRTHSRQGPRELSPPPAIRILFPTEASAGLHSPLPPQQMCSVNKNSGFIGAIETTPSLCSSPVQISTPVVGTVFTAGKYVARLYGGKRPSRLPSTTAARRAIITTSSSFDPVLLSPCNVSIPQRGEQTDRAKPMQEGAWPYPAEDVEALVARAKQLETDRLFLLSEVRRLSQTQVHKHGSPVRAPEPLSSPPLNVAAFPSHTPLPDDTEERYTAQQREIQRLEAIVQALRDERHSLLQSVKTEIFQY